MPPRNHAVRYRPDRSLPDAPRALPALNRRLPRTVIGSSASARAESYGSVRTHLVEQPGAREPDVAMHGRGRGAGCLGDLFVGETTEIVQFNDLRKPGFELHQALERVVERDDIETRGWKQVRFARIALDAGARFGMIDQDAAHEPGGKGEEMRPVLQRDIGLNETQERLVHHRGCLQGMAAALPTHVVAGEAPQFVIDQRRQALQRLRVTRSPLGQQLCEVCRRSHRGFLVIWAKITALGPKSRRSLSIAGAGRDVLVFYGRMRGFSSWRRFYL